VATRDRSRQRIVSPRFYTIRAVERPFRFGPPAHPSPVIERERLLALTARRWSARVVSIVAGPGFGKTTLLAAAWAQPVPLGARQVWLTCEPTDIDADHLEAAINEVLELPPGADLRAVLDAVWAERPGQVCLVFDDVHEIPTASPGAALLEQLLRELPANAHVVLAARDRSTVPLARLHAAGEVVVIEEGDLVFDAEETAAFAAARGVPAELLAATGGWPALAELTATAGGTWTLDYLREEVLSRIGPERARLLTAFAIAGGGDDEIASAVADRETTVEAVVDGVPLVRRSADGWSALHPLWLPALRRLLDADAARAARCAAARVHLRHGRYSAAFDLLVEAEDWDGVMEVIRAAERTSVEPTGTSDAERIYPHDFGRWAAGLPRELADEPTVLLASAIGAQPSAPLVSADRFRRCAAAFEAIGDVDGELAAISREGVIRMWLNDVVGLVRLHTRIAELARTGSPRARSLAAVGMATVAHVAGDSEGVFDALRDFGEEGVHWAPSVQWLRSVAHRRLGELEAAHDALAQVAEGLGLAEPQLEVARLRIRWLEGDVEVVADGALAHHSAMSSSGDLFLVREAALEAAARLAWLGDADQATELLTSSPSLPDVPSVLADVLRAIATAAIAVEAGDEDGAAGILAAVVLEGPAAIGQPESWYWYDRAAVALVHVLVPETRAAWSSLPLAPALAVGRDLAEALEAAREGGRSKVARLAWPADGVLRAHLPRRWVAELLEAGRLAGRARLTDIAVRPSHVAPVAELAIAASGPLTIHRAGRLVESANLRRTRVRELLCYLVAHRRARREVIAEELWPESAGAAHNLRVTLNYLLQALEPDRDRHQRPTFVQVEGGWLGLVDDDRLGVDLWDIEEVLDRAAQAERRGDEPDAIEHYRALLPLWSGEPLADVPYALWAEPIRFRLRAAYVTAAIRAADLLLALGASAEAGRAARRALTADPGSEPAFRVLARSHVALGDASGARTVLARCQDVLGDLGLEPDYETKALTRDLDSR
jgi:DNA-binding SARP family transcriptional activator